MVHIDRAVPDSMNGDDQRLAQVITNLLGNAVKFTPEHGSISLDAQFLREESGLCVIQIDVKDTGIGISQEQQKKLFQSFHQAETSTTRKFGGTGLGLAISKSIVEMMDGSINIHSEPGKGSTFSFTVKMKRGTGKKQFLPGTGKKWTNLRILTVDDDPDILMYFREIMQGFGIYCDTASSGQEALRLIKKNGHYSIYFLDWKMPEMDGVQLASIIKSELNGDSVIIMISAAEWTEIETEAKKAGVDKFLSKPLFPSAIIDAINETLGLDKQWTDKTQTDIKGLFAGRRILLAEDVDINREIVLALLEPAELQIDCAENGLEAVRIFSKEPQKYDMIFMDVQMPEMDGYEATRQIRVIENELMEKERTNFASGETRNDNRNLHKQIPIVAMTANVFREDVEKCLEAGMNSHVGKPLVFEDVIDKLRDYLL